MYYQFHEIPFILLKAEIYPGRENSIHITQRYLQEFSCHFMLEYYPFDTQVFTLLFLIVINLSIFVSFHVLVFLFYNLLSTLFPANGIIK